MVFTGMAVVGVFLNWIDPGTTAPGVESRLGIEEDDGFLVIVVAVIGVALAFSGVRAAWIAPAFGAAIAIRDATRVDDNPTTEVGFGLWITSVAFAIAAGLLIVDLVREIRSMARGPD